MLKLIMINKFIFIKIFSPNLFDSILSFITHTHTHTTTQWLLSACSHHLISLYYNSMIYKSAKLLFEIFSFILDLPNDIHYIIKYIDKGRC